MRALVFLSLLLAAPCGPVLAADVDAAIVFAVDASASIDRTIARLQREGHARALSEPRVIAAIATGLNGCIAIAYLEWSSPGLARLVLPWTVICNRADGVMAAQVIRRDGAGGDGCSTYCGTSISSAIAAGSMLLDAYNGHALTKVIDISASGTNNDGPPIAQSRLDALRSGYIINAIAIPQAKAGVAYHLLGYFIDNVIGGSGSFALEPATADDYAVALRKKLQNEISKATASASRYEIASRRPADR
ncbi:MULTISPECIES: DUF1194 domain-containing protein [unclassified Sinorhizobium]|uniref:DUF1194 domain-containing protein n=1 Tax=unclassified Sinorhizobium TaxID=2613772 RepID=UPI0024C2A6AC|nr:MULTISPECIES: DUF1194 domain-containing protein [unclassified Sinorhizobium]MDK1373435.1 DUF1194 domain-containing protein [Sinorhizobium sp. 6-70]MDK1481270.1 DUF1194 domain-containing protein [Sinorhizobium sp. 6-117]